MNRRKFIKTALLSGAYIASKKDINATNALIKPSEIINTTIEGDVIVVKGGNPNEMFREAINKMGGINSFITKGDKVCIKPNIRWNKTPELAANTNPDLIAEIVKQCFDAGAKEVVILDHTIDDWKLCYTNSGIESVSKSYGAIIAPSHMRKYYKEVYLPEGKNIKYVDIHEAIINADKWINVPVLKHHGTLGHSIAKKNYMGIVWDRSQIYNDDIHQSIEDICTYSKKPILNIVDAYRVISKRGPKGGGKSDVVLAKTLFASKNLEAIEYTASNFLKTL